MPRVRQFDNSPWRWLACLSLLWSAFGIASSDLPLRLITVDEAPANFVVNGQLQGYATDIVQAIQQQLGDTTSIEVLPEDQALHVADTRPNVLLFSFSRTHAREHQYIWLLPVLRKKWQLFMPMQRHGSETSRIRSESDFASLARLGVVRGDVREAYLKTLGLTNLVSASSPQQMLTLLQQNQLDAIISSQMEIDMLWNQFEFSGVKPAARLSFGHSDAYLLFSKDTDPALVAKWQKALSQLRQQGVLRKIAMRWQDKLTQYSGQTPRLLPGDWLEY